MKKYFAIFKYSLKKNLTFLFNYLFSTFSFTIHVFVFSELWDYILKDGSMYDYTKNELMWYIILTEFITYCIVSFYKDISEMVKDGTIANMLIKPVNFLVYTLFEQSANLIKVVVNAIAALILGFLFAGPLEINAVSFGLFILACIQALVIGMLVQLMIGLIAFYLEETRSVWLLVQKVQLLLVFIPLEFYGDVVQKLLLLSPTTHMVYTPASILVKANVGSSINGLGMQSLTILFLIAVVTVLYRKGVKKINVNGG